MNQLLSVFVLLASLFISSYASPCLGGGFGDPKFMGFHGQRFYFIGQAGGIYNIFSDQWINLNTEFDFANAATKEGTVMKTAGLTFYGNQITVDFDSIKSSTFLLNGKQVVIAKNSSINFDCAQIASNGTAFILTTPNQEIIFEARKSAQVHVNNTFLNFITSNPIEDAALLGGLLGRTASPGIPKFIESDFVSSSLFSTDAVANKYSYSQEKSCNSLETIAINKRTARTDGNKRDTMPSNADSGFESDSCPGGAQYCYTQTLTSSGAWTFGSDTGIAKSTSAFAGYPDQTGVATGNYAFVQTVNGGADGVISKTFNDLAPKGRYLLQWSDAGRNSYGDASTYTVTMTGSTATAQQTRTYTTANSQPFNRRSLIFETASGSCTENYVLSFSNLAASCAGDCTFYLDDVTLVRDYTNVNEDFSLPSLGANHYEYITRIAGPTTTALVQRWTYNGNAGLSDGTNGFNSPQGVQQGQGQFAFLQYTGSSISRNYKVIPNTDYLIRFSYAIRDDLTPQELTFTVTAGSFSHSYSISNTDNLAFQFETFTTQSTNSMITLTFAVTSTNPSGADSTMFIDEVTVVESSLLA